MEMTTVKYNLRDKYSLYSLKKKNDTPHVRIKLTHPWLIAEELGTVCHVAEMSLEFAFDSPFVIIVLSRKSC